MTVIKNFLVGILVAFVCSFAAVANAEEVDAYFVWDIKNLDDYKPYSLLFESIGKTNNGVVGMRDNIYWATIYGRYSEAATWCELTATQQKIAFGADFFDDNLTELTAKLYLTADELDEAERKINFLYDNAQDNSTKIRALNLKSDLLNRRGNYREALTVTGEVDELLSVAPDEKLSLINRARAARAYCGLGDTQKSLTLAENLLPQMQTAFGNAGIETLALMSTLAENYRKAQRHNEGGKILANKLLTINERYKNDPVIGSKVVLELADFCFDGNDNSYGEEFLNSVFEPVSKCADMDNNLASLQLCKALYDTANKHLDGNNPMVLKAALGLARMNNAVGNIPQSIELCKKNLPTFKKVFGDAGDETLALTKTLSDDYLLLGRYADAKKVVDDALIVCKKNFGDHDVRTVAFTIELINICYRTGKYKTGDKLLADVKSQSRDILEANLQLDYDLIFAEVLGARMRGSYETCMQVINSQTGRSMNFANTMNHVLEVIKVGAITGLSFAHTAYTTIDLTKIFSNEYHPKDLELMTAAAESYIRSGELNGAENLTRRVFELSRAHFGENNFYDRMALDTLAKIRRAEGNFADALNIDKQALQIAEKVCGKNSLERLQSLDAIADDHAAAGNITEAIKIREQALSEYKKITEGDDEITLRMMTNLAENYVAAKRYAEAVNLCDDALAKQNDPINVDGHISLKVNITDLFRIKATAQKLSGDTSGAAENYMKLIQAYEIKRNTFNKTFSYTETKSEWFAKINPVYKDAAIVANELESDDMAFYCMEFCKGRSLIDRYDDILVAKNYLLTRDEKNKLKTYQELLNSCRSVAESSAAQNDDTLRSNVAVVYQSVRMKDEKFKKELRQKYSNYMVPKDPQKRAEAEQGLTPWEETLKNFDVTKNRQAIPDGACLIEFMKVSDNELLVMFLQNDTDVTGEVIAADKDFFDNCRLYHDLNAYTDINALHRDGKYLWQIGDKYTINVGRSAPAPSAVSINDNAKWNGLRQEISAELSRKLIPTIEKYAGNSTHQIISPDAELNLVPFETLIRRDKMLIESADVSYVPSLAVLNLMKSRERKNAYLGQGKEFFAMGDAVYGSGDAATSRGSQSEFFNTLRSKVDEQPKLSSLQWNNLPGTARELDKVSELFDSKDVFRREQVTEKNLQDLNRNGELSKYKYILFATHGLFVPDMPEVSSIVLSQQFNDEDTDGYVTVGEWMGYDLRSKLVYLSACESGLGGYQAGEGIVGIPYALTVAGNKDTVMSLWKVDDEATAEFTSAVFEKLSKGQSEVAALNETKREFIKNSNGKYNNPSVWAAFLLYGI